MPSSLIIKDRQALALFANAHTKMSKKTPIYLMDGGLGTTLADKYDCVFDDSTPLWSSHLLLSNKGQEKLQACQEEFVSAGADVILTATYQLHPDFIEDAGFTPNEAQQKMRDAIKIARGSFGAKRGTVVLGLGAYGAIMRPSQEYTGDYGNAGSIASLRNFHTSRLAYFMPTEGPLFENEAGLQKYHQGHYSWENFDLVAFETIPRLEEITAVRDAMAASQNQILLDFELKPENRKKFWISCVYPGTSLCLPDGTTVSEVIRAMLTKRAGADTPMGVGINCTKLHKVEALVQEYEASIKELIESGEITEWPSLVVYPDGTNGEVYNTTTHAWVMSEDGPNSHSWDELVCDIVKKAEARGNWKSIYVGGCCKTAPYSIAKLRMRLDQP